MAGRLQVGTLREKPLHAALKRWHAEDGGRVEQPVDGLSMSSVSWSAFRISSLIRT
jgi:hypothetical protein